LARLTNLLSSRAYNTNPQHQSYPPRQASHAWYPVNTYGVDCVLFRDLEILMIDQSYSYHFH
jgi:hypothetical protein